MFALFSKVTVQLKTSLLILGLMALSQAQTNFCLNRPAVASSTEGANTANKAVDGVSSGTSRWASSWNDKQWIYIDLGYKYTIDWVKLVWESASAKSYTIDVADKPSGPWTTISSKSNMIAGPRTDNINNISGVGRYIRMNGLTRNSGYGFSLYEFEAYGTIYTDLANNGQAIKVFGRTFSQVGYGGSKFVTNYAFSNSYYIQGAADSIDERNNDATAIGYITLNNTESIRGNIVQSVFDAAFRRHRPLWYTNYSTHSPRLPNGLEAYEYNINDHVYVKSQLENNSFDQMLGEQTDGIAPASNWSDNTKKWYDPANMRIRNITGSPSGSPPIPFGIYRIYLDINPSEMSSTTSNYCKFVFKSNFSDPSGYNGNICNSHYPPKLSDYPYCESPLPAQWLMVDLGRTLTDYNQWNGAFVVEGMTKAFEKYLWTSEFYMGPNKTSIASSSTPKKVLSTDRNSDWEFDYKTDYLKSVTYHGLDNGFRKSYLYHTSAHWNY